LEGVSLEPKVLECEQHVFAQDERRDFSASQWSELCLRLLFRLEASRRAEDAGWHAVDGHERAVELVLALLHRSWSLGHALSQPVFDPPLVVSLHGPQALRRVGGYLVIDELVVRVAQQDQVLVPVPIGWSHERIASRAGWTRGDDMGNIAKDDGLFPRRTLDDEYPPAVAERTPIA
jgi:hypothetical protein